MPSTVRDKQDVVIERLNRIEQYVLRVMYTISLIVMVITLLTVEFAQMAQVLKWVVGK